MDTSTPKSSQTKQKVVVFTPDQIAKLGLTSKLQSIIAPQLQKSKANTPEKSKAAKDEKTTPQLNQLKKDASRKNKAKNEKKTPPHVLKVPKTVAKSFQVSVSKGKEPKIQKSIDKDKQSIPKTPISQYINKSNLLRSKTNTSNINTSKTNTSNTNTSKTNTSNTNTSKTNTSNTSTSNTNTSSTSNTNTPSNDRAIITSNLKDKLRSILLKSSSNDVTSTIPDSNTATITPINLNEASTSGSRKFNTNNVISSEKSIFSNTPQRSWPSVHSTAPSIRDKINLSRVGPSFAKSPSKFNILQNETVHFTSHEISNIQRINVVKGSPTKLQFREPIYLSKNIITDNQLSETKKYQKEKQLSKETTLINKGGPSTAKFVTNLKVPLTRTMTVKSLANIKILSIVKNSSRDSNHTLTISPSSGERSNSVKINCNINALCPDKVNQLVKDGSTNSPYIRNNALNAATNVILPPISTLLPSLTIPSTSNNYQPQCNSTNIMDASIVAHTKCESINVDEILHSPDVTTSACPDIVEIASLNKDTKMLTVKRIPFKKVAPKLTTNRKSRISNIKNKDVEEIPTPQQPLVVQEIPVPLHEPAEDIQNKIADKQDSIIKENKGGSTISSNEDKISTVDAIKLKWNDESINLMNNQKKENVAMSSRIKGRSLHKMNDPLQNTIEINMEFYPNSPQIYPEISETQKNVSLSKEKEEILMAKETEIDIDPDKAKVILDKQNAQLSETNHMDIDLKGTERIKHVIASPTHKDIAIDGLEDVKKIPASTKLPVSSQTCEENVTCKDNTGENIASSESIDVESSITENVLNKQNTVECVAISETNEASTFEIPASEESLTSKQPIVEVLSILEHQSDNDIQEKIVDTQEKNTIFLQEYETSNVEHNIIEDNIVGSISLETSNSRDEIHVVSDMERRSNILEEDKDAYSKEMNNASSEIQKNEELHQIASTPLLVPPENNQKNEALHQIASTPLLVPPQNNCTPVIIHKPIIGGEIANGDYCEDNHESKDINESPGSKVCDKETSPIQPNNDETITRLTSAETNEIELNEGTTSKEPTLRSTNTFVYEANSEEIKQQQIEEEIMAAIKVSESSVKSVASSSICYEEENIEQVPEGITTLIIEENIEAHPDVNKDATVINKKKGRKSKVVQGTDFAENLVDKIVVKEKTISDTKLPKKRGRKSITEIREIEENKANNGVANADNIIEEDVATQQNEGKELTFEENIANNKDTNVGNIIEENMMDTQIEANEKTILDTEVPKKRGRKSKAELREIEENMANNVASNADNLIGKNVAGEEIEVNEKAEKEQTFEENLANDEDTNMDNIIEESMMDSQIEANERTILHTKLPKKRGRISKAEIREIEENKANYGASNADNIKEDNVATQQIEEKELTFEENIANNEDTNVGNIIEENMMDTQIEANEKTILDTEVPTKRGRKSKAELREIEENMANNIASNADNLIGKNVAGEEIEVNEKAILGTDVPKKRGRKSKAEICTIEENVANNVVINADNLIVENEIEEMKVNEKNILNTNVPKKRGRKSKAEMCKIEENIAVTNADILIGEKVTGEETVVNEKIILDIKVPNKRGRKSKTEMCKIEENMANDVVTSVDYISEENMAVDLIDINEKIILDTTVPKKRGRKSKAELREIEENMANNVVTSVDKITEENMAVDLIDVNEKIVLDPKVPKKRGRKSKAELREIAENIAKNMVSNAHKVVEENVTGEEIEENKNIIIDTKVPKKRGRKSKAEICKIEENLDSNVDANAGNMIEENLDVHDVIDETKIKKRGRKPRTVKIECEDSFDANITDVTENIEITDNTDQIIEETVAIPEIKVYKKRGRKPKAENNTEDIPMVDCSMDANISEEVESHGTKRKASTESTEMYSPHEEIVEYSQRGRKRIRKIIDSSSEDEKEAVDSRKYARKYKKREEDEKETITHSKIKRKKCDDYEGSTSKPTPKKTEPYGSWMKDTPTRTMVHSFLSKLGVESKRSIESVNLKAEAEVTATEETCMVNTPPKAGRKLKKSTPSFQFPPELNIFKKVKMVTCAICKQELTNAKWVHHKLRYHNNLAWRVGEPAIDLENKDLVAYILNAVYAARKPLHCEICGQMKKSVLGYLSHKTQCMKSPEEIEAMKVKCEICGRKIMPSSVLEHERIHRNQENAQECREIREEEDELPNQASSSDAKKRRAAVRATDLIHSIAADRGGEAPVQQPVCRIPACEYRSTDIKDAEHHYETCDKRPEECFVCKVCVTLFKTEEDVVNHLAANHSKRKRKVKVKDWQKEGSDATDTDEPSGNDSQGEEEMLYEPSSKKTVATVNIGKFYSLKFMNSTTKSFDISQYISHRNYGCTLQFCEDNFSANNLFQKFAFDKTKWLQLNPKSIFDYLPTIKLSIPIAYTNVTKLNFQHDNNVLPNFRRYKLFESEILPSGSTIFCGGPISAIAWAPTPFNKEHCDQILAVSVQQDPNKHIMKEAVTRGKNIIQFWNYGPIQNEDVQVIEPKLEFCIAHDLGVVWKMEWCPSGCYNETQLGLLAVTCSDYAIYCFSICHPGQLSGKIFLTKPTFKLVVTKVYEMGIGNTNFQATVLSWSKYAGHAVLAAGYSNGVVALFNLHSDGLLSNSEEDIVIYSYMTFQPHFSTITGISLYHLNEGKRWLATASKDRVVKFWDLEDIKQPISSNIRLQLSDIVWLNNWLSTIDAQDESLSASFRVLFATSIGHVRDFAAKYFNALFYTNSAVNAVSGSDWSNMVIQGNNAGEIQAVVIPHFLPFNKEVRVQKLYCGYTRLVNMVGESTPEQITVTPKKMDYKFAAENYGLMLCDLTADTYKNHVKRSAGITTSRTEHFQCVLGNMYPVQSITTLAINPNRFSFLFTATGYHMGFVKVSHFRYLSQ